MMAAAPCFAARFAAAAGSISVASVQPATASFPSRASSPIATRSGCAEPRVLHGDRAHDHAGRTGREHRGHGGRVAQPPAHLHRNVDGAADGLDELRLHRTPLARAVEIDDVQPARARGLPAPRDRDRIVAVDRLLIELALEETHAPPAAQVDRGVDDHPRPRTTRTKPSRRRSPTCWLFSGWNWQAKTLSRVTLEANSGPYSVVVAMTAESAGTG
jgi:hypothetical protein